MELPDTRTEFGLPHGWVFDFCCGAYDKRNTCLDGSCFIRGQCMTCLGKRNKALPVRMGFSGLLTGPVDTGDGARYRTMPLPVAHHATHGTCHLGNRNQVDSQKSRERGRRFRKSPTKLQSLTHSRILGAFLGGGSQSDLCLGLNTNQPLSIGETGLDSQGKLRNQVRAHRDPIGARAKPIGWRGWHGYVKEMNRSHGWLGC